MQRRIERGISVLLILGLVLTQTVFAQHREATSDSTTATKGIAEEASKSESPIWLVYDLGIHEHSESNQNRGDKAVISKIVGAIQDSVPFDIIKISWTETAPAFWAGDVKFPAEHWGFELLWNRQTGVAVHITGVKPYQRIVAAQYIYSQVTDTAWISMFKEMNKRFVTIASLANFGAKLGQTDISGRRREL